MSKENFNLLFKTIAMIVAAIVALGIGVLTLSGKVAPWTGRFYSLLDPSYAKNNIPIIASVSEHQPTAWSSFYFDLQILTFLFPAGLYYCFTRLTDHNIFIILYGVTSVYFAGVMVSQLIFAIQRDFSVLQIKKLLYLQSKSFNSVGRNISALVGCIKKLRALYEVQLLEIYKIPQLNFI